MDQCRYCDEFIEPVIRQRPDTPHGGGEKLCPVCGRHLAWIPKEKNLNKRPKNKYTPNDLKIEYCQMCLRTQEMLGVNETLEVHHVIEIKDDGDDEPENIFVLCTACHKDVHHKRIYLYEHFLAKQKEIV